MKKIQKIILLGNKNLAEMNLILKIVFWYTSNSNLYIHSPFAFEMFSFFKTNNVNISNKIILLNNLTNYLKDKHQISSDFSSLDLNNDISENVFNKSILLLTNIRYSFKNYNKLNHLFKSSHHNYCFDLGEIAFFIHKNNKSPKAYYKFKL